MSRPCWPAGEHLPQRHRDKDLRWPENPVLLSQFPLAHPPPPPALSLPSCLQPCAENLSSTPRAPVTPSPQPLGTRPPNKEPPPSLSLNTIKGPALPSESVSLAGKPGTGSGTLSLLLALRLVIQWASSPSSKKGLGKCPRALARAPPSSTHACLPSSPGNQPMSCLGSQPLPGLGTSPGGLWEADFQDFPPHISMCFGSPTQAVPKNGQVPRLEALLGDMP